MYEYVQKNNTLLPGKLHFLRGNAKRFGDETIGTSTGLFPINSTKPKKDNPTPRPSLEETIKHTPLSDPIDDPMTIGINWMGCILTMDYIERSARTGLETAQNLLLKKLDQSIINSIKNSNKVSAGDVQNLLQKYPIQFLDSSEREQLEEVVAYKLEQALSPEQRELEKLRKMLDEKNCEVQEMKMLRARGEEEDEIAEKKKKKKENEEKVMEVSAPCLDCGRNGHTDERSPDCCFHNEWVRREEEKRVRGEQKANEVRQDRESLSNKTPLVSTSKVSDTKSSPLMTPNDNDRIPPLLPSSPIEFERKRKHSSTDKDSTEETSKTKSVDGGTAKKWKQTPCNCDGSKDRVHYRTNHWACTKKKDVDTGKFKSKDTVDSEDDESDTESVEE
ncbi:hypothetical protein HK097_009141 [Rhizophlyctis rosea]|uniref:Uncharacterized protein n=1 Tax=Rhizophlyctis rosea TaxID=64517 RepID=A0AAD5X438_9FUNG|nr:hypothetical protein HK097_009141 [Rhizophlyctis rosea]